MAAVRSYTDQIAQAAYGREVRTAILDAINAVSDENNTYNQVKTDIQALNESVQASYNGNQVIDQEIKQTATDFPATATELEILFKPPVVTLGGAFVNLLRGCEQYQCSSHSKRSSS